MVPSINKVDRVIELADIRSTMGYNPGSGEPGGDKSRLARNEKSIDNNRINSVSAVTELPRPGRP